MPDALIPYVTLRLAIGAGIGLLIGTTGVGGGILVIPALTVLLGIPTSVAIGTANLFAFIAKSHASLEHARLKNIDWRVSARILGGAIPGTILASLLINVLAHGGFGATGSDLQAFQASLRLAIAWIMLGAIGFMLVNLFLPRDRPHRGGLSHRHPLLGLLIGFGVGVLIGTTSIGGGVVLIPILMIGYGLSGRMTVGSSIFISVVLTLLSSVIYLIGGQLDVATGLVMWLGSVPGVYFGSRLSVKIPDRPLKIVVVVLIGVSAVMMFFGR